MKALVFETFGGLRTKAVGLYFADINRRKGNYHLAGQPPFILGYEGAVSLKKSVQIYTISK